MNLEKKLSNPDNSDIAFALENDLFFSDKAKNCL